MIVKKFLKEKRELLKLNGTDAAVKIGITQGYLSDLEKGNRLPSDDVAEQISNAYNFNASEKEEFLISVGLEKAPEILRKKFEFLQKENDKLKKGSKTL